MFTLSQFWKSTRHTQQWRLHKPPCFHFHFPKIPNFQARKSTCRDASYAHILLLVVLVFILCQSPRLFLNFWEIFLDKCAQTQFGPPVWYEVSQRHCWSKLTLSSIHWMIPGLPFQWSKKSAVSQPDQYSMASLISILMIMTMVVVCVVVVVMSSQWWYWWLWWSEVEWLLASRCCTWSQTVFLRLSWSSPPIITT